MNEAQTALHHLAMDLLWSPARITAQDQGEASADATAGFADFQAMTDEQRLDLGAPPRYANSPSTFDMIFVMNAYMAATQQVESTSVWVRQARDTDPKSLSWSYVMTDERLGEIYELNLADWEPTTIIRVGWSSYAWIGKVKSGGWKSMPGSGIEWQGLGNPTLCIPGWCAWKELFDREIQARWLVDPDGNQ